MASNAAFRLRLQRSFLGLTPPAWVPDEDFDLDRHIIFADEVATSPRRLAAAVRLLRPGLLAAASALARAGHGADDGNVAIGMMMHHASLDGLSGMRLFSSVSQASADEPLPAAARPVRRRPRGASWQLPLLALSQWWQREGSLRAAWSSYWAKPFLRRVRRVAARITLPLRYSLGRRARRAPRRCRRATPRIASWSAGCGGRRARALGGHAQRPAGLGDHRRVGRRGAGRSAALSGLVPLHGGSHIRNHVRDMEVYGDADADLSATIQSVHEQVERRDDSKPYPAVPGFPLGYSTLLPWVSRPRYFCGGEIIDVAPFPASLGRDSLAAAGIMYRGSCSSARTCPSKLTSKPRWDACTRIMTGDPDPGRAAPA